MTNTNDFALAGDVDVQVRSVPRTRLVHLNVDTLGGLVITYAQAAQLGRDLLRATGQRVGRGPAGAGAASRGATGYPRPRST
jgi:hypothetical protein